MYLFNVIMSNLSVLVVFSHFFLEIVYGLYYSYYMRASMLYVPGQGMIWEMSSAYMVFSENRRVAQKATQGLERACFYITM